MGFGTLALIALVGALGPVLATPSALRLPVVLGELLAGVVLGNTGFGILHPADPTFSFLGDVGFALVMFVGGTHVPMRDARLLASLRVGVLRAATVGLLSVGVAILIAGVFHTGHPAL